MYMRTLLLVITNRNVTVTIELRVTLDVISAMPNATTMMRCEATE